MNIEKLVVAPQIVIYKNIFKYSKELIDLLENDNMDSLFSPWREWYEQGYRKNVEYINDNTTNLRSSRARTSNQYGVDAQVIQYGKDGTILRSYGIVGALALGIGLAIGLGGKDTAGKIIADMYRKMDER